MENAKLVPYTYGNLGLFLGAVCGACGVISDSTLLLGFGAAAAVLGAAYLVAVRARRAKATE